MRIYVASSWRNETQPEVVIALRRAGFECYDFKTEEVFSWREIAPNWENWDIKTYLSALYHPLSEAGFKSDFGAVLSCDACVLVMPCGLSAGLEAGHMKGAGKFLGVYCGPGTRPDLMVRMADVVTDDLTDIIAALHSFEGR